MELVMKILVCYVVFLYGMFTSCQENRHQQRFYQRQNVFNNARRYIHAPIIKFELPKRLFSGFDQISETVEPRFKPNGHRLPSRQNVLTTESYIVERQSSVRNQQNAADCSDFININCDEQTKLIGDTFMDSDKKKADTSLEFPTKLKKHKDLDTSTTLDYTESTTNDYETTMDPDEEISNRIAPEVVASLLG